jgi:hypothetical protein
MKTLKESDIHTAICQYIKWRYPKVIFTSESGGIKTTIGQAKRIKNQRSEAGIPDLIILEPRGEFHGLCIEIKRSMKEVYNKNGTLKASAHLSRQIQLLARLSGIGYCAEFGLGFESCKEIIDNYLKLPLTYVDFSNPMGVG